MHVALVLFNISLRLMGLSQNFRFPALISANWIYSFFQIPNLVSLQRYNLLNRNKN